MLKIGLPWNQTKEITAETHVSELATRGYTVIPNVLAAAQIKELSSTLDSLVEQERKSSIAKPADVQVVCYMLPHKGEVFRSIYKHPRVLPIIRSLLGNDCVVSSINGVLMIPHGKSQKLHADHSALPDVILTVQCLFLLDDFRKENGCTRIVPFSQPLGAADASGIPHANNAFDHLEEKAIYLEAAKGSVICFDGQIIHAGSQNSSGKPRRALNVLYGRRWVKPKWDIPASLPPSLLPELTEEDTRLLGYFSRPLRYNMETYEPFFD